MPFPGPSAAILLVVGALLASAGCGQTGALYLPEEDRPQEAQQTENEDGDEQEDPRQP